MYLAYIYLDCLMCFLLKKFWEKCDAAVLAVWSECYINQLQLLFSAISLKIEESGTEFSKAGFMPGGVSGLFNTVGPSYLSLC